MEKEITHNEKKIRAQSQNETGVLQSRVKAVPEDMPVEKKMPNMPVEWSVRLIFPIKGPWFHHIRQPSSMRIFP